MSWERLSHGAVTDSFPGSRSSARRDRRRGCRVWLGYRGAGYLVDVGPMAALLSTAREVLRLLATLPWVGPTLATAWLALVVFVSRAAGGLIASLVALIPFEIFRAGWEANDRASDRRFCDAQARKQFRIVMCS